MLTQFFLSINWVDVSLLGLAFWIIFVGIKDGVVSEVFKLFGVFLGLFVSLHWYSFLASFMASKMSLPAGSWEFISFVFLLSITIVLIKFVKDGFLILFHFASNHQGFDKYGGGVLAVLRAVLLTSLIIFALCLLNHQYIARLTQQSWAKKTVGKVALLTYKTVFNGFVGPLFPSERYNLLAEQVLSKKSQ